MRALEFQQRRDVVVPMLNAAPGLKCLSPEGAFYTYPSCAGVLGRRTPQGKLLATEEDFVIYLLDNGVASVQGEIYGLSPYLRLSIASGLDTLKEACWRIQRACEALS